MDKIFGGAMLGAVRGAIIGLVVVVLYIAWKRITNRDKLG
jgi:hypothetical protein